MKTVVAIDPERASKKLKKNKKLVIAIYIIIALFVIPIAIIIIAFAVSRTQPTSYDKCVVLTATSIYNDEASHKELFEKGQHTCFSLQKVYNTYEDFNNYYDSQWEERSGDEVGGMTLEQWLKEYKNNKI